MTLDISPRVIRNRSGPMLQWVALADGTVHHVVEFSGTPPKERPVTTCPLCGDRVTPKLGKRVVAHAAHLPGVECAATAPETALHLNAKFHVAEQLKAAGTISLVEACRGASREWYPCKEVRAREWGIQWDRVEVEWKVGTRRPDITLLLDGTPTGAVEILVSHAVDARKVQDLAALGLPWVEVKGAAVLPPKEAEHWERSRPLPVLREAPAPRWRCDTCARGEEERREVARRRVTRTAERIVDLYHPHGTRSRRVYRAFKTTFDDVVTQLGVLDQEGETVVCVKGEDSDETKALVKTKFKQLLEGEAARGVIVDILGPWKVLADDAGHTAAEQPHRYMWSATRAAWKQVPPVRTPTLMPRRLESSRASVTSDRLAQEIAAGDARHIYLDVTPDRIMAWIEIVVGPTSQTHLDEGEVYLSPSEGLFRVTAKVAESRFSQVWFDEAGPRWPTGLEMAREASAALGVEVFCLAPPAVRTQRRLEPGMFLRIQGSVEDPFIWCGDDFRVHLVRRW